MAFAERRRRRLLRGQGLPVHRGGALDPRRGPRHRRLHRRRARGRPARRRARRIGSACTATTSRSPSSAARSTAGVGRIVVDSFEEIDRVADVARRARRVRAPVLLRVTVGVEAHTHEFIATAHEDQKFGLLARRRRRRRGGPPRPRRGPSCDLLGLHSHIGSQIFDTAGFEVAARRVLAPARGDRRASTASSCPSSTSAAASASPTRREHDPLPPKRARRAAWPTIVERECAALGVAGAAHLVEPGRAIAGPEHLHALRGRHGQGRRASTAAPAAATSPSTAA